MTVDLIGRRDCLELLASVVDESRDDLSIAIVRGAAGVGKTALVEHLLSRHPRVPVMRTAARPELARIPLALIAELGAGPDGTAPGIDDEKGVATARAVDALADRVSALNAEHAGLLVVEDLHWADRESLEVLGRVVGRIRHERLAMVMTTRSVTDGHEGLSQLIGALDGSGAVIVDLPPLVDSDARRLIETVAPAVSEEQVAACLRVGRGNPLMLRHLSGAGRAVTPSGSLGAVVEERLGVLTGAGAHMVRAASLGGNDVLVELVAAVVGSSTAEVTGWLEQATEAGLVARTGDGWRFEHDLIREAVADSIGERDRVGLHRRWAAALLGIEWLGADPAVDHVIAAGPPFESWEIDVLLRFGMRTVHTAPASAAEAFSLVLEHTGSADDRHRSARTGAAEARLWSSRSGSTAVVEGVDPLTRLRFEFGQGRVSGSTLADAERAAREAYSGEQLDETLARVARYASASLHPLPHLLRELDDRSATLTPLAEVWLRHAQDRLLILSGEFIESMWIGERAKAAGDQLPPGHPARIEAALTFGRLACQTSRRHVEGFEALRWAERRAEDVGSASRQIEAYLDHGMQLKMWDRWDEAEARFDAGAAIAEEIGAATARDQFDLQLAELAIVRGDVSRADGIVSARAGRPDPVALWAVQIGHLRLVRGQVDEAIQTLVPLAEGRDVFPEVRRMSLEILAHAAFVADDEHARGALRAGCRRLTGEARPARVCRAMVLASVDGDGALADAALAELGDAPPYVQGGYTMLGGVAHKRADHEDRAIHCFTVARELAAKRGAVPTVRTIDRQLAELGIQPPPSVADRPATGWASITPAEMRVVEVVAEGLVYREIAERLFISRRTVESHVASALRKLGLRNRSQLAAAFFSEHGLR